MLAPIPGKKPRLLKVVAPDGEKVALPYVEALGLDARANHRLVEGDSMEFDSLIDPGKDQDEDSLFPVTVELSLGREFLEISFSCIATSLGHLLFEPEVRSRIGELLDEAGGIAAVSEAMGEWRSYSRDEGDDEEFEVPEDRSRPEVEGDEFAAFLVDLRRSGAS